MAEVEPDPNKPLRVVGRYALYGKLATGGMATVHFGRLLGPVGFSRTCAIKRLHPEFAKDPEFVAMFLDEARLAARIQHPNVVATLDVVAMNEELFLVMDYVRGESFSRILRSSRRKGLELPEGFVGSVVAGMLHGLHAAHEATDERGEPLQVVHRDVSPQNVLVGVDGVPRVLDFGVAKAAARSQVTRDGQMKGKLSYMSPEQLQGQRVDRRSDIFAAGVVLWEALTGHRLFTGEDASQVLTRIISAPVPRPSQVNPAVRPELDALVLRALEKNPAARYATSREFAIAVEQCMQLLSPRSVGEWVEAVVGDILQQREQALAEIESISSVGHLADFNDSDPQLMRTLVNTWSGQRRPVKTPAVSAISGTRPAFSHDEPTRTYQSAPPTAPDIPALDDKTTVDARYEDLTQPGQKRVVTVGSDPELFRASPLRRKRVVFATLASLIVLLLGVVFAATNDGDKADLKSDSKKAKPTSEQSGTLHNPPGVVDQPASANEGDHPEQQVAKPSDLPSDQPSDINDEDGVKDDRPKKPVHGASGKPKPPQPPPASKKCAQPWSLGADGVRRIRPECL
jgi:serine/threonine-protein kinase